MILDTYEFATEAAALQAIAIIDGAMGFPTASTPHAVAAVAWASGPVNGYFIPARPGGRWYIWIDSRQVRDCAPLLADIDGITTEEGSVIITLNRQDPPEE